MNNMKLGYGENNVGVKWKEHNMVETMTYERDNEY